MNLFKLQILSRYPETFVDGNLYTKLTAITALRLRLSSLIKPTGIRIKNNGATIHQESITYNRQPTNQNRDNIYFNLWLNLQGNTTDINRLTIEFQLFGIYIPFRSIIYILASESENNIHSFSDAYIQPNLLKNPLARGIELQNEILTLTDNVRSTAINNTTNKIRSIILLRLDQLGDFVMTAPSVIELRKYFPEAKITMLVSPANECIARSTLLFDEIYAIPFSFKQNTNFRSLSQEAKELVGSLLKNKHFDIAADLSPMPESRELLGLISADKKFGFENTNTSMIDVGVLIHAKDPINNLSNISHAIYPLLLVDTIRRVSLPETRHIPRKTNEAEILEKLNLYNKNYIVIHSGARNILVRWPIDKYISIANTLADGNLLIVFFADEPLSDKDKSALNLNSDIILIDSKMNFDDFDIILSNASLFIGNDSGPKHLAAMRAVPVISIHSPRTNWSEWGQLDSGYIISKRVPCSGCAIVTEDECGRHLQCIRDISVETVLKTFYNAEDNNAYIKLI